MTKHPDSDETYEPYELALTGPDNHWIPGKEGEWNTDVAESNGNLHKLAKIEGHASKTLKNSQVSAAVSPETKVEKEGSLDMTNKLCEAVSSVSG